MTESNAGDILVSDGDHSAPLEFDENPISCHPFRRAETKWFTDGEQLQKRRPGSVSPSRRPAIASWIRGAGPTPPGHLQTPWIMAKFARLEQIGDELSGKEDVALGRLPHSLRGDALDDAVESPLEHLVELGSRQCLELEPRNSAVSSESAQGIGDGRSTAQCEKHGRQTPEGDIVDEPRREPVEQVHVLHRQDDRPTFGPVLQILAEDGQQVHLVDLVQLAGKELSQRTERKWAQRFRSGNPFDVVVRRPAQSLVNQSAFFRLRLSGDQDTGSIRIRDGIGYETQLLGSPDHWPPVHGP